VTAPHRRPNESRLRTAPGALVALFVFLASFSPIARPRITAGDRRAPELTWSADARAPVGDVERGGERQSNPAVRPRRGAELDPWRTPSTNDALLPRHSLVLTTSALSHRTDAGPAPARRRPLAPRCPRGPPTA
jgi:hypothetical protein